MTITEDYATENELMYNLEEMDTHIKDEDAVIKTEHLGALGLIPSYKLLMMTTIIEKKRADRKEYANMRFIKESDAYPVAKHKYQCHICRRVLSSSWSLSRHLKIHPSSNDSSHRATLHCYLCYRSFTQLSSLNSHSCYSYDKFTGKMGCDGIMASGKNAKGSNEYQCNICQKMFSCKRNLKRHRWNLHEKYQNGGAMLVSSDKHTGTKYPLSKKEYKCDICQKLFSCKKNVKRHRLNLHEKYKNGSTKLAVVLNDKHTGAKYPLSKEEHKCNICQKLFSCKKNLKRHRLNLHEKYKNRPSGTMLRVVLSATPVAPKHSQSKKIYRCNVCKKTFSRNRNLRRHLWNLHEKFKIHNRMPNLVGAKHAAKENHCDVCQKKFSIRSSLNRHKRKVHKMVAQKCQAKNSCTKNYQSQNKYKCNICEKIFSCTGNLNRHVFNLHRNDRILGLNFGANNLKNESFQSQKQLPQIKSDKVDQHSEKQMWKKPHNVKMRFKCKICRKMFASNSNLVIHKQFAHSKKYISSGKQKVEPPQKKSEIFSCKLCQKNFSQGFNLIRHNKTVHNLSYDYKCHLCGKKFMKANALKIHKCAISKNIKNKLEIPEKKQTSTCSLCKLCGKSLCSISSLNRHLHNVHKLTEKNSESQDFLQSYNVNSDQSSENIQPSKLKIASKQTYNICGLKNIVLKLKKIST